MKRAVALVLVTIACFAAGCSNSNSRRDEGTEAAQLRAINLVSDSPSLQLFIDGIRYAILSFTQSTTLRPGIADRHRMALIHSPLDGSDNVTLAQDRSFRLKSGVETSLIFYGTMAGVEVITIESDVTTGDDDENAEVRYVNAASGGSALDIYLSSDPASTSINGITPISLESGEHSALVAVTAGNVRLLITASGSSTILYDSGPFPLSAGGRRLIAITDHFGAGGAIRAMQIGPEGAATFIEEQLPAELRVAHAIDTTSDLDLLVDGAIALDAIAPRMLSDRVEITAGAHTFTITPAGQPATTLFTAELTLNPGERRTLVTAGAAGIGGRFVLDDERPVADVAQVRFIHAAPEAGGLSAYLLESDEEPADTLPDFVNFTPLASGTVMIVPGSYELLVTEAGDTDALLAPTPVTVTARGIYTILVSASPGGTAPVQVILADDFVQ